MTTEALNNQSFFDIVWERAGNRCRAVDLTDFGAVSCRYRSKDGLACFVGAAIPDDLYHPGIEGIMGRAPKSSREVGHKLAEHFAGVSGDLISDCQKTHDVWHPSEWRDRLASIGSHFGLKVPD